MPVASSFPKMDYLFADAPALTNKLRSFIMLAAAHISFLLH
jgi:hypothetical protein